MYMILIIFGLSLISFGMLYDSPSVIFRGLLKIITQPDILITDYMGVGGLGATFVNAGLLTLIAIAILYLNRIKINGLSLASVFLMAGFGMFGKNIMNIWFILLGVFIYAKIQKDNFSKYIYVALFGTCLSPMVTQIMYGMPLPFALSVLLSVFIGILIGVILPPLSSYLMRVHQGFNLYNIGFVAGIIGTVFVSILRSYGFLPKTQLIWTSEFSSILGLYLAILFIALIGVGLILGGKEVWSGFKHICTYSGRAVTDFIMIEGLPSTLVNMGINGFIGLIFIWLVGGELNGPIIGGIFTLVGFGAFGKHAKNIIPIMAGVFLGSLTKIWSIGDPSVLLAALFSTTLAPIAGEFGWKYGILAGFIHSSVVLNVGVLHGGLNLYNNGFAGGLVAATLVPIIEAFRKEKT